jgi:hypothetical protein
MLKKKKLACMSRMEFLKTKKIKIKNKKLYIYIISKLNS